MPKGGFGNLIALPLQKQPRENGCSVFVDADLRPYASQWGFLAGIQLMAAHDIEPTILRATGGKSPPVWYRLDKASSRNEPDSATPKQGRVLQNLSVTYSPDSVQPCLRKKGEWCSQ